MAEHLHQCGACGAPEMAYETRTVTYEYKNAKLEIPGMAGWFCDVCGDAELDDSEGYFNRIQEFTKKADADEGEWLVELRKRLHLSVREAVAMTGGGKNAFQKYRFGARPMPAVLTLFSLLERHPDLVDEVKAMPHVRSYLTLGNVKGVTVFSKKAAQTVKTAKARGTRRIRPATTKVAG